MGAAARRHLGHHVMGHQIGGVEGHGVALGHPERGKMGGKGREFVPFVVALDGIGEGQEGDLIIESEVGAVLAADDRAPVRVGLGAQTGDGLTKAGLHAVPIIDLVLADQRDEADQ